MKPFKRTGYPKPVEPPADPAARKRPKKFMPYPDFNPENNMDNPEYERRMMIESEKVRVAQRARGFSVDSQAHLPATERSEEELFNYRVLRELHRKYRDL